MKRIVAETIENLRAILFKKQSAYQFVFSGELGQDVLADLAEFCRAHESTFSSDQRLHAMLEGRREVWLRIERNLNLSSEQIWKLYERNANG